MIESEWLASEDPAAMLEWRRFGRPGGIPAHIEPISDCKLRLFACGCCRLVWNRLADPRSRRAVEVAERYADGEAAFEQVTASLAGITQPDYGLLWSLSRGLPDDAARRATEWSAEKGAPPAAQAALLREICGNPWRPVAPLWKRCSWCAGDGQGSHEFEEYKCPLCKGAGKVPDSPWLTTTVLALARAAYVETREVKCGKCKGKGNVYPVVEDGSRFGRTVTKDCPDCGGSGTASDGLLDPDRLAVLADALEDAGCTSGELLMHLRGQERCDSCERGQTGEYLQNACEWCDGTGWVPLRGPHVRGCWALDLILGKE